MAADIVGLLPTDLAQLVNEAKVLVVGAGGIGCELLKNLVLTGFKNITIIDLDTIEVSNLNRQFLFRREHVGRPKSLVAKESVLLFYPRAKIQAIHDNVTETKYNVDFYKQFDFVMNALDNKAARSHVNRMCLAAEVTLLESGSAGYKGSLSVHKKGFSECFDCNPRPTQKTFPGCTIRNTPSEPIHCIVWAKHLFNQLFGMVDSDEDVSPDSSDPEAVGNVGKDALDDIDNERTRGPVQSTRVWAKSHGYNTEKLFQKFFCDDIKYLLSMENLWEKRRPPTPLERDNLPDAVPGSSNGPQNGSSGLKDQRIWSIVECAEVFERATGELMERMKKNDTGDEDEVIIWDKDDDAAMDFVTACANIRSFIFDIQQKSRFDIKSMAGNIIPAIASTNAIVAGLIVLQAFKIMKKEFEKCKTIFVSEFVNVRKQLFATEDLRAPNPKCYVCTERPELVVKCDLEVMTVSMLGEKVLKKELCMVAPDVEIDDGKGTILISSEPGETDDIADKMLKDFGITNGSRMKCDDFLQNYTLNLTILSMSEDSKSRETTAPFVILGDPSKINSMKEKATKAENGTEEKDKETTNDETNKMDVSFVEEEEDLILIEEESEVSFVGKSLAPAADTPTKRPRTEEEEIILPAKKRKVVELTEEVNVMEVIDID